jgi:rubrerythrin
LPPGECLPEIWLTHAEHAERARELLRDLERLPQRQWLCPGCGERVEGGFEQCWNCGALMPR